MVDGFNCLGHNPVIRRNHQYYDIRYLSTPCPHRREGLMAGGVNKHNSPRIQFHIICANMLRDPSRFILNYMGFSNGI